jgi:cellulose synthase/poly-beta-1,6-N-acetylglucosamine synthase-like glycosyltransferase
MMRVRVVIPCRNEEAYIGKCVSSLVNAAQTDIQLSILVADGMSDDGTRREVLRLSELHSEVKLMDNIKRTTPFALNLGLRDLAYDVGIILGAHAEVSPDFLIENVRVLREHPEVGCAGGIITNVHENELSRVISNAMSSPFGVGNAYFRTGGKSGYVDTVAFGAYRREVFEQVGFFDEDLVRNQDDEFNYRVTKAGFKIYLEPKIESKYYVRGSFSKLYKQYFQYGYWKVFVNRKHATITTLRQLAPPLWMLFVSLGWLGFLIHPFLGYAYVGMILIYLTLAKFTAIRTAGWQIPMIFKLVACYMILHASYGWGYLKGMFHFYVLRRNPTEGSQQLTR